MLQGSEGSAATGQGIGVRVRVRVRGECGNKTAVELEEGPADGTLRAIRRGTGLWHIKGD